jgi:hypothetical protein
VFDDNVDVLQQFLDKNILQKFMNEFSRYGWQLKKSYRQHFPPPHKWLRVYMGEEKNEYMPQKILQKVS